MFAIILGFDIHLKEVSKCWGWCSWKDSKSRFQILEEQPLVAQADESILILIGGS